MNNKSIWALDIESYHGISNKQMNYYQIKGRSGVGTYTWQQDVASIKSQLLEMLSNTAPFDRANIDIWYQVKYIPEKLKQYIKATQPFTTIKLPSTPLENLDSIFFSVYDPILPSDKIIIAKMNCIHRNDLKSYLKVDYFFNGCNSNILQCNSTIDMMLRYKKPMEKF